METASPDWLGFGWQEDAQLLPVTGVLWNLCSVCMETVQLPGSQAQAEPVAKARFSLPVGSKCLKLYLLALRDLVAESFSECTEELSLGEAARGLLNDNPISHRRSKGFVVP